MCGTLVTIEMLSRGMEAYVTLLGRFCVLINSKTAGVLTHSNQRNDLLLLGSELQSVFGFTLPLNSIAKIYCTMLREVGSFKTSGQ